MANTFTNARGQVLSIPTIGSNTITSVPAVTSAANPIKPLGTLAPINFANSPSSFPSEQIQGFSAATSTPASNLTDFTSNPNTVTPLPINTRNIFTEGNFNYNPNSLAIRGSQGQPIGSPSINTSFTGPTMSNAFEYNPSSINLPSNQGGVLQDVDYSGGYNVNIPMSPSTEGQPTYSIPSSINWGTGSNPPPSTSPSFFSKDGMFSTAVVPGIQALSGLGQLYLGKQQLDVQKDAFNFNRDLAKTNLENQANLVNQQISDRQRAAAVQSGRFDTNTTQGRERLAQEVERISAPRRVRGTV